MKASRITLNRAGLQTLVKQLEILKEKRVRVGILADKTQRQKGEINNAEIGLEHEFGVPHKFLPARSFLRMPLMTRLGDRIQARGSKFWGLMVTKKGADNALAAMGHEGEFVVQQSFESGGWGHWPNWSHRYTEYRKSIGAFPGSLLILSAQMRQAITSKVTKK